MVLTITGSKDKTVVYVNGVLSRSHRDLGS